MDTPVFGIAMLAILIKVFVKSSTEVNGQVASNVLQWSVNISQLVLYNFQCWEVRGEEAEEGVIMMEK